jgi:hypothetical protein
LQYLDAPFDISIRRNGVRIHASDYGSFRRSDAEVKSSWNVPRWIINYPDSEAGVSFPEIIDYYSRRIVRHSIDDDDFITIRFKLICKLFERLADKAFLVVTGNDNGHSLA